MIIFIIFSLSYILIFNKKIIDFYHINYEIRYMKKKIMEIKQKKLMNLNISHKKTSKNYQWLNNNAGAINQLIDSIKKINLIQYQVNDLSKRDEKNFHIRILELSLIGNYFTLIHWLSYEMPYFCFLEKIAFKKMQKGIVNLTMKVEVYET